MTLKYIIVGLGNIGAKRKKTLNNKLVATVDVKNKNADYIDFKDVSLTEFDVAILSIPNCEKFKMMEYFLENGKNIIVEKPLLFENNEKAEKLKNIAKRNDCIWYTSYNHYLKSK